jgi:hypothetical protein
MTKPAALLSTHGLTTRRQVSLQIHLNVINTRDLNQDGGWGRQVGPVLLYCLDIRVWCCVVCQGLFNA